MPSTRARRSDRGPALSEVHQNNLVRVRDLSVDFTVDGEVTHAVKRVSFNIRKGETVALVGESGSGKTVSALSVLRLLPYPAASHPSGEVYFHGRNLLTLEENEMRAIRGGRISIIFQEPMTSLNPLQTILQQVGETLRVHRGMDKASERARVLELLDRVGIREPEKRLASYPHQLSGGQRQRVMIAMALAGEPEVLLADEPTTALDVTVQAQILGLLAALRRDLGLAVLFITHDLAVVAEACDRVAVMYAGQMVEEGAARSLFARPAHPYTAALLAALPHLDRSVRRGELAVIPGRVPEPGRLPPGCAFHPRCERAMVACPGRQPAIQPVGEAGHRARCLLHAPDLGPEEREPLPAAVKEGAR